MLGRDAGACANMPAMAMGTVPVWTVRGGAAKQASMTDDGTKIGTTGGGAGGRRNALAASKPSHPTKEDRRKAALKANMARRKDQARLRAAQRQDGDTPDDNDERGE
ncbi:MAG: hypothetical protein CFE34_06775 [Rhodobacteraceae bacterium PARR1]|nr:MAG: hypothetical protein CFE34_06775 [Rhodobacteraceae bacterium PARR1]